MDIAFGEALYFAGSWQRGQRIRFLTPEWHDVTSEIAENRPNEFLSIRHLGYIADDGVEDTSGEVVRAWAPAYENYTFAATPQGTGSVSETRPGNEAHCRPGHEGDFEGMVEAWPKALG